MRVYYEVRPTLGRAMHKIREALVSRRPSNVEMVQDPRQADVQFIETIGADAIGHVQNKQHVYLQFCLKTATGGTPEMWADAFSKATLVVSYLDVPNDIQFADFNFLHTPLGVDEPYRSYRNWDRVNRPFAVCTSGYVAIEPGEAVDKVYLAAASMGLRTFHLGPREPEGMPPTTPLAWTALSNIPDDALADMYSLCTFVSGLRYGEGFELPMVEGALCGARPIAFDLPCYRQWFGDFAYFVPHDSSRLQIALMQAFESGVSTLNADERAAVRQRFDWDRIATEFWGRVSAAVRTEAWV